MDRAPSQIAHQHCAILGAGHAAFDRDSYLLGIYLLLFTRFYDEDEANYTKDANFSEISTSGFSGLDNNLGNMRL
jgi:hypothetical protein